MPPKNAPLSPGIEARRAGRAIRNEQLAQQRAHQRQQFTPQGPT